MIATLDDQGCRLSYFTSQNGTGVPVGARNVMFSGTTLISNGTVAKSKDVLTIRAICLIRALEWAWSDSTTRHNRKRLIITRNASSHEYEYLLWWGYDSEEIMLKNVDLEKSLIININYLFTQQLSRRLTQTRKWQLPQIEEVQSQNDEVDEWSYGS